MYIGYGLAFAFNFIVESYGWRWAFRIASFPGFIISVLLLLTVKEPKQKELIIHEKEMEPLIVNISTLIFLNNYIVFFPFKLLEKVIFQDFATIQTSYY